MEHAGRPAGSAHERDPEHQLARTDQRQPRRLCPVDAGAPRQRDPHAGNHRHLRRTDARQRRGLPDRPRDRRRAASSKRPRGPRCWPWRRWRWTGPAERAERLTIPRMGDWEPRRCELPSRTVIGLIGNPLARSSTPHTACGPVASPFRTWTPPSKPSGRLSRRDRLATLARQAPSRCRTRSEAAPAASRSLRSEPPATPQAGPKAGPLRTVKHANWSTSPLTRDSQARQGSRQRTCAVCVSTQATEDEAESERSLRSHPLFGQRRLSRVRRAGSAWPFLGPHRSTSSRSRLPCRSARARAAAS